MYRPIMVDDETMSTDIIQEIIDFEKYGFELAATFSNGKNALEYVKSNHVDVVITDIKMPVFTGIDLVKGIREFSSDTEILFLTAYPDFEYATFGIDNNIYKYILKPITIQSFTEALINLKKHLDGKQFQSEKKNIFKNFINASLQKSFHDFIYKENSVTLDSLCAQLSQDGFDYDLKNDYMTIIDIDFMEYGSSIPEYRDSDSELYIIKNLMCRESILACPLIYSTGSIQSLLICKADNAEQFTSLINNFKTQLIYDLAEVLNLQATITTDCVFTHINQLASYVRIYEIARHDAENITDMIVNNIDISHIQQALDLIIKKHSDEQMYMRIYTHAIYQFAASYIEQSDFIRLGIYDSSVNIPIESDEFDVPSQISHMIRLLPQTITALSLYFTHSISANETAVNQAISYINENYSKPLSLISVANHVYRNPAYLSRSIKEITNMSFTDYLNSVRIANAKNLLISANDSIYMICEKTGYNSISHFRKKFKEITGYTPKEYRQKFSAK